MQPRIQVQTEDFSLGEEYARLTTTPQVGAIVAFVGCVRDMLDAPLLAMTLEHYPGMTEKSLRRIAQQAAERWPLQAATIIHRVGTLRPGDQIVLVLTASAHRQAAYEANAFIMDYLKTQAPFWKRETTAAGDHWVEAKESDNAASLRWDK